MYIYIYILCIYIYYVYILCIYIMYILCIYIYMSVTYPTTYLYTSLQYNLTPNHCCHGYPPGLQDPSALVSPARNSDLATGDAAGTQTSLDMNGF